MSSSNRLYSRLTTLRSICIALLTIALAACSNAFAQPNAQSTAQPVAVITTTATDERFDPTLRLDPPGGYAGLYVQVTGAGWPPNMMVVVLLTDPNGISTTVASKDTDSTGNLVTGFLYPIDARWLLDTTYTIAAESADGRYRATAAFRVVEPGAELPPTPLATATPTEAVVEAAPTVAPTVTPEAIAVAPTETATPLPPTATATAPSPTATPLPEPTATPTVEPSPTPTAQVVDAAPANNQLAFLSAAFVPGEQHRNSHQIWRVEVNADDDLREVMSVLAIPRFDQHENVRLRTRNRIEIKIDQGKFEITAPDPQALLDTIRQYGGIPVPSGQRIEYRISPEHLFRLEYDDGTLVIRAADLLLQVSGVDATGQRHTITVTPPALDDDDKQQDNRGRNHDDDDNDDDNDDDRDKNKDKDKDKDDNQNRGRGRGNNNRDGNDDWWRDRDNRSDNWNNNWGWRGDDD